MDLLSGAQEHRPHNLPPLLLDDFAAVYANGPTRQQFRDKDPRGWEEFRDLLARQSAKGHALTMGQVQMKRPSI
ncbi:MAG TPA: hypothetical protein VE422_41295 [Terriglobia bacterium]|nr:hypothetical protein [Terriglobia bacterium]